MEIENKIVSAVVLGIKTLYGQDIAPETVQLQKTKKEFAGHLTLVVFPFLKISRKKPEDTAQELGHFLKTEIPSVVADFNAVKGFLNLVIAPASWIGLLTDIHQDAQFGLTEATDHSPLVMIEYSSPNTNKPLHLGHVRNNLLGCALANIMERGWSDLSGNCRKPRHAQRQCHVPPICGACGLLQDGISIHRPGEYPSDAIRKIRPTETQTALRRSLYLLLLSERCVQSREIPNGLPENPSEKQQGQSAGSRCGRSSHHRRRQPIQCRRKLAEGHQRKAQERGLLQGKGRYRQRNPHQIAPMKTFA